MTNGHVEMVVKEVQRQCRTLRISAEENTGVRNADDSVAQLSSLFCSASHEQNERGKDGKTSDMKRTGRR